MQAFSTPVGKYAKLCCYRERALVGIHIVGGRLAVIAILGGTVAWSGAVVLMTSKLLVASTRLMGGPCELRVGAVAAPLIVATDLVRWPMRMSWAR